MMNRQEIFAFLNQYTVATLATTDGERPYLRYVWTVKSDENGILFHTGKMKDMFKQLMNNPNVEICFVNEDRSIQIRVFGKARMLDDLVIKNELAEKRPFLKDIEKKLGNLDFLSVFLLEQCVATVWTMQTNMMPKEYVNLFNTQEIK